jgi:hypothetical protein
VKIRVLVSYSHSFIVRSSRCDHVVPSMSIRSSSTTFYHKPVPILFKQLTNFTSQSHVLSFLAIFLLSHLLSVHVTAHPQYNWGGLFGGGNQQQQPPPDAEDDEPNPWYRPAPSRSTPAPRPPPIPTSTWSPWGPAVPYPQPNNPWYGPQPTPGTRPPPQTYSTATITRTSTWFQLTPTPSAYSPPPASSTRTWTAPSAWGPPRNPFGPQTATPLGPQTIATTTTELPKAPVPFVTVCGGTRYVEDDVSNALITGCYYKNKTTTVNKSGFPKAYTNPQNFNFGDIQGGLWEFPLISSAGYVGGKSFSLRECRGAVCDEKLLTWKYR